jgi:hypothetical protein
MRRCDVRRTVRSVSDSFANVGLIFSGCFVHYTKVTIRPLFSGTVPEIGLTSRADFVPDFKKSRLKFILSK